MYGDQVTSDIRDCIYDAYRAGHWHDDSYVDQCMTEKHGYMIGNPTGIIGWDYTSPEELARYDKKKGLTSR